MSDWNATRCDGCGVVATDATTKRPLPGWYIVRIQRREPFLDTGYLDLCPTCGDQAYEAARKFPRPPPKTEDQPTIAWAHPAVREQVSSLIAAVIAWAEQCVVSPGPRTQIEQRLLNAHVDLASACAREVPQSQGFRLPVAEYVCKSDKCAGLSTRVRATGSAIPNNPPKCAYCLAPMEQVPARGYDEPSAYRKWQQEQAEKPAAERRPWIGEVSKLPCSACGVNHRLGEFAPGSRVITKVPRAQIPTGVPCIVREWSQYGGPIYYRVHDASDEQIRENYTPCELEAAS